MRARPLPTADRRRHHHGRRGSHGRPAAPRTDECRAREAGGPLDLAFYGCEGCGYGFSAAVSTSVSCPHCGSPQDW